MYGISGYINDILHCGLKYYHLDALLFRLVMLLIMILVCLLLPALAVGSTVQQDLLCTDSYAEFESASVGSNISGANLRNQLYKVFYTPNQILPYSVFVNYQLVLANGTRLNLSSDQDCSSELWVWVSSPVFLAGNVIYTNQYLLFTLNNFMEWTPPLVTITATVAPCPARMRDFLSEMTASVGAKMHAWLQSVVYSYSWSFTLVQSSVLCGKADSK